jgi:MarR family transcriptional regulator for hemolysin
MHREGIERRLATRLSPLSRAWQQLADQELAMLGVSNSTGWCLVWIDRLGGNVRQADLARAIGVREASLVRTLNQLESAGYVMRQTDPKDRRANHLFLTAEGLALAGQSEERLVELRHDLLADLPTQDLETVVRVFETLTRTITERRLQP